MTRDREGFYVPVPIAGAAFRGDEATLDEASASLARTAALLDAAPYDARAVVTLLDARRSSEFEGFGVPLRVLLRHRATAMPSPPTLVTDALVTSLALARGGGEPHEVVRPLLDAQGNAGEQPGPWRDGDVWVGRHAAPRAHRVPGAMEDLAAFGRRDDLHPVLRAAVYHAQFETIHPFVDGNGRSGRALTSAQLEVPMLGLLKDGGREYVRALNAYRDGLTDPMVSMTARAIAFAEQLTRRVRDAIDPWWEEAVGRTSLSELELLRALPAAPVMSEALAERLVGPGADAMLHGLEDAGVLQREKEHWVAMGLRQRLGGLQP